MLTAYENFIQISLKKKKKKPLTTSFVSSRRVCKSIGKTTGNVQGDTKKGNF